MTRVEKLAEARGLLDEAARTRHTDIGLAATIDALRLTLDLIETSDQADTNSRRAEAPKSAAFSPAPDFAALAEQLLSFALFPIDYRERLKRAEEFLSNVWPKPAPAVVRDEAWWKASVAEMWKIVSATYVEPGPDVESWLKRTFGQDPAPAPAFDVEALAQSIAIALRKKMRGGSMVEYLVTDDHVVNVVRAVAREMLKGGGR